MQILQKVHLFNFAANRQYLLSKSQHLIGGFGKLPGDIPGWSPLLPYLSYILNSHVFKNRWACICSCYMNLIKDLYMIYTQCQLTIIDRYFTLVPRSRSFGSYAGSGLEEHRSHALHERQCERRARERRGGGGDKQWERTT